VLPRSACAAHVVAVALIVAGCGSGGGRNEQLHFDLSLLSVVPCFGTHIELQLARSGGKITKQRTADCTLSAQAALAGCTGTSVFDNDDLLTLDIRDCFVTNDELLFECSSRGYRIPGPATVQCGCGCQSQCPGSPSICITQRNKEPCNIASLEAGPRGTVTADTVQVSVTNVITATSTTTPPCGTCCDLGIEFEPTLDDAVSLRELYFEVELPSFEPMCPEFEGCSLPLGTDGPSFVRETGTGVEICISDSVGFSGPAVVAECSVITSDSVGPVTVRRALDVDLAPVVPLPNMSVSQP